MDPMEEDTPSGGGRRQLPPPAPLPQPPAAPTPPVLAQHQQQQQQQHQASPSTQGSMKDVENAASDPSVVASGSKRKRGLGIVTPNACTECRKKRAKCDGQRPCGRCKSQRDVQCVYEIPVRQSKETLRHELDQLRRQQRSNEKVIAALVRPGVWEEVLARLRGGQTVEAISDWLEATAPSAAGALPSISRLLSQRSVEPPVPPPLAGYPSGPSSYPPLPPPAPSVVSPGPSQHSPWGSHFSNQSHPTPSNSLGETLPWNSEPSRIAQLRVGTWVESQESARGRGLQPLRLPSMSQVETPSRTWTAVTADTGLVQHLLSLYFCWEYPTFASLSKEHFQKDLLEGRPRFCSSILVNALLSLGCRFSSRPNTRANPDDPHTSGNHFFKECQRLYYQEKNHHNLTTIQALGIMSIREASCGRDSESWYYAGQSIRLAIEMGLHRTEEDGKDPDEVAVKSATFWGAFALDHAWSLATGSLPQCACFPRLPPKPGIIDDIEASVWFPYTDDGAPLKRSCEQPSNVRSVSKCFCELSELVHQSLYILHSPGQPLASKDLLSIYTQYLNWYDKIPEVLRLGHNFTPAVLFAHMYYHFAILLLFRPLIKLRIIGSSITPRDVCSQAADAITGLLRSYSQLYTLRRTPSFVPYFVLTSSIMHLSIAATGMTDVPPPDTAATTATTSEAGPSEAGRQSSPPKLDPHVIDALSRGIADLTEMAPCHHFAAQALNILKFLAKKWSIDVDITTTGGDEPGAQVAIPDDPDQSTRPVAGSLNFFAPNFSESDFSCAWGNSTKGGMLAAGTPLDATELAAVLDNPLFWPFPMQGRPMLPSGKELKEAGFEII